MITPPPKKKLGTYAKLLKTHFMIKQMMKLMGAEQPCSVYFGQQVLFELTAFVVAVLQVKDYINDYINCVSSWV